MTSNRIDLVYPVPSYVLVTFKKAAWKVVETQPFIYIYIQPAMSNQGCRGDCKDQSSLVFTSKAVY